MPVVVVTCPTCRQPLTVAESSVPYTVACPTCHNPLTAPAIAPAAPAPPPANPFEDATSEPSRPAHTRRSRREPLSGQTMFFIFVGVLVAVVMSFLIYDRVSEYLDKRRLRALNRESIDLITQGATDERHHKHTRWLQVEWDRSQIIRDHPEWGP